VLASGVFVVSQGLDQEAQQQPPGTDINPTALHSALAGLRHQSRRHKLGKMMRKRRFRDAERTLQSTHHVRR
jgi:hypothetical protein